MARSGAVLDLDDAYTNSKEEEGEPLGRAELLAEEDDGEGGSGENLHLIRDLERGDREIANGDELERVLDHV